MLTQKSSDTTFAKKWKLKLDLDSKIKAPSKAQGFPNRPDPSSWRLKKPAKTRQSSESTGSSPAPWPFESGTLGGCSSRRRPYRRRILRMILDTRYGFRKRKLSPDSGVKRSFSSLRTFLLFNHSRKNWKFNQGVYFEAPSKKRIWAPASNSCLVTQQFLSCNSLKDSSSVLTSFK